MEEHDNILKSSGFILDFSKWDDSIHFAAVQFHDKYNVYPNILLASDSTYRKIDLYAQKHPERIVTLDDDGGFETIETSNEPYTGLSSFTTEDYELECCMDYDLQEGSFVIIFDEAPDFDGEPEPVTETEGRPRIYQFKKIA